MKLPIESLKRHVGNLATKAVQNYEDYTDCQSNDNVEVFDFIQDEVESFLGKPFMGLDVCQLVTFAYTDEIESIPEQYCQEAYTFDEHSKYLSDLAEVLLLTVVSNRVAEIMEIDLEEIMQ